MPGVSAEPVWIADHESGDLTQYTENSTYGGSYDSHCERPPGGVVAAPEPVFNGSYSMKMTALIEKAKPGCRQFRYEESSLGHALNANEDPNPLYYSVWMYFPEKYYVRDWTNIIQFKSKTFDKKRNDAFWVLELENRRNNKDMYLMLRYKGILPGPTKREGPGGKKYRHRLTDITVPVGEWFNVEIYLVQSTNKSGKGSDYNGQIVVWQDGVELYNMPGVATRYPDSWNEWSVNVYTRTNGIIVDGSQADLTVYVDDVAISRSRVWDP